VEKSEVKEPKQGGAKQRERKKQSVEDNLKIFIKSMYLFVRGFV